MATTLAKPEKKPTGYREDELGTHHMFPTFLDRLLSLMVSAVLLQLTFPLLNGTSSLEFLFFYSDERLQAVDARLDLEDMGLLCEPLRDDG